MCIFYTEGHFRFTFRGTIQRRAEVMELETEDQINFDYNIFFYPTVCHVCKKFGDNVSLKKCGDCEMISYCSKEHQKQHWAQHNPLCKIIQNVLTDGLEGTPPDDWYRLKMNLIKAVEKKKRFLELYEREMFLFPEECAVCHEEDLESLVVCRKCAISFCKDHIDGIAHRSACEPLEIHFRLSLLAMKKHPTKVVLYLKPGHKYVEHGSNTDTKTPNIFRDMNSFINNCWNIEDAPSETYKILVANMSEFATRPLTLFYAMQVLNYVRKRKEIVIHIVAAGEGEKLTLKSWELLLHFIRDTSVSLMVIMIGTELKSKYYPLSICEKCLAQGKKASVKFHKALYESYACSPMFVKPDIIVGFNVGIEVAEYRSVPEMTELSIKALAKQNCPFILTSDEQEKLEKYTNNINTILNRTVGYLYSGKNPFTSLRPFRWPGQLILYNNRFVVIYRSLCS